MKNLKTLLFLTSIFITLKTQAQQVDTTWLRQYDRVANNAKATIVSPDSNKFIVQYAERYYEINGAGDSLTSGLFDTLLGSNGPRCFTTDGFHHYAGGWTSGGAYAAKLDANYNIVWSTLVATASFGQGVDAIIVDSNYIYASGSYSSSKPFITKLDSAGNIVWHKEFQQTTFSTLTHLMKLSDGNYLANGNLDDYPLAIKFNSLGDTSWTYTEPIFISFNYSSAAEKANGNVILAMRNTLVELDPTGSRVDSSQGINDYYDIFREGDTLYLFGIDYEQQFSSKKYAFVETRNLSLDSTNAWRKTWGSHPFADNGFNSVVRTSSGGFIAAGKHRDSVDITNNTYNILVARFNDTLGKTNVGVSSLHENLLPIKVYPTPADDKLIIGMDGIDEVILTDLIGNKIVQTTKNGEINTSRLAEGFYLLNVRALGQHYYAKIVIRH